MSFQSAEAIIRERNLNLETATEGDLRGVLWEAFGRNIPIGRASLVSIAEEAKAKGGLVRRVLDPKCEEARESARLLGTDVARRVCEEELGVTFGLLNCHIQFAIPVGQSLVLTARDQILAQIGGNADC